MLRIRELAVVKAGTTILNVPELNVHSGDCVAILGPNGSGKTTLLRVIGGLENDYSGECLTDIAMRNRVFVHQAPLLFRGSVLFNAMYGLTARRIKRDQRTETAMHWLRRLGVHHLAGRNCDRLSGGEQRRVALARAFALEADILLLDEPFADLDEPSIRIVCDAILAMSHSTVVMASPVPLPAALPARIHELPPGAASVSGKQTTGA